MMVWGSGGVGWGGFVLGIEATYQVVVSDIQVFCSTSCQKLMMDFKLYICYAADGLQRKFERPMVCVWQELNKLIVFGFTSKKVSQRH